MSEAKDYPYIQFSTEPHQHLGAKGEPAFEHEHRTWPEFHGHGGLPLLTSVRVHIIEPESAGGRIWPPMDWDQAKEIVAHLPNEAR